MSTRPMHHILDLWAGHPTLTLHNLTRHDIRTHVDGVLNQKSSRITASESKASMIEDLVNTILCKADGVFVWVHYVLRTVCSGIRIRDDLAALKKHVKVLPSEMSDLYRTMWKKHNLHNQVHAEQSAVLFRWMLKQRYESLLSAALQLDPVLLQEYANCMKSRDPERLHGNLERYRDIVSARSAGLVECQPDLSFDYINHSAFEGDAAGFALRGARVQFIHSTVFDFLENSAFGQFLLLNGTEDNTASDCEDEEEEAEKSMICNLACIIERCGSFEGNYRRCLLALRRLDECHSSLIDTLDMVCKDLVDAKISPLDREESWVSVLAQVDFPSEDFNVDFRGP